jgi:hypothetical protein
MTESQKGFMGVKNKTPRKSKKSNALILYDCCKQDGSIHTNIELLIVYHKDFLVAEIIARKFDYEGDEDIRLYLNYLELYKRIETVIYTTYENEINGSVTVKIPFKDYNFSITKDDIVNYVLERLNINILNKHNFSCDSKSEDNKNVSVEWSEQSSAFLVCDKPLGLHHYDIKHHRQNSM